MMRQAWHIFKKDLLYLQRDIALYVGTIVAAWALWHIYEGRVAEILVWFCGAFLIARVVHADALNGTRQFWITRPYRWQSLLAAKLLFVVLFIGPPILLAQWYILAHNGFSTASVWQGLLWQQVLWFAGFSLPLVALAALTSGLVPYVAALIALMLAASGLALAVEQPAFGLGPLEWVRSLLLAAVVLVAAGGVVSLQFRTRHTLRSAVAALSLLAAASLAYIFVPWSFAFGLQQTLSKQPVDPASIAVSRDMNHENWAVAMTKGKHVPLALPLTIDGMPSQELLRPEVLEMRIVAPDGRETTCCRWEISTPSKLAVGSASLRLNAKGELDRAFFGAERDRRVTLRGSLYLTVFGNQQAPTIDRHWSNKPVAVTRDLICYIGPYGVYCNSPFRWPKEWVGIVKSGMVTWAPLNYAASYAPFATEMRFFPLERRWATMPVAGAEPVSELAVEVLEPLAYVRRDFEIRDVPLIDIAVPWRSQRVSGEGKSSLQNEY